MRVATTGKVFRWSGDKASWYFLALNKAVSKKLKDAHPVRRGWGSIRMRVTIGNTTWETSVFPDKDRGYVLPIKASVRKRENIHEGTRITASLVTI